MCYIYITPFLFEAAGADLGRPLPPEFERGFAFCKELPDGSKERKMCFSGFGKEFLVLAQDRDVRAIESMNADQMYLVLSWCELAHDEEGTSECILSAVYSAYWGGENKPDAAILLCSVAESSYQEGCFEGLTEEVGEYVDDTAYRSDYCTKIPEQYREHCEDALL